MSTRTLIGSLAVAAMALTAATAGAQGVNYPRYGGPAFGRSGYGNRLNYNGGVSQYQNGGLSQYQVGGATVTFGPGGGSYGYSSPVFGYSAPYGYYGGYASPYYGGYVGGLGYGYSSPFGNYYGYAYGY